MDIPHAACASRAEAAHARVAERAPEPEPPQVDRTELGRFVHVLFAHAEEGGTVSLRAFYGNALVKKRDDPPFMIG